MFKKFGIHEVREIGTPMSPTIKLNKDEKENNLNQKLFRGMIESFFHLTASSPM